MLVSIANGDSLRELHHVPECCFWLINCFNREWRFFEGATPTAKPPAVVASSFNREWRFFEGATCFSKLRGFYFLRFNREWRFFEGATRTKLFKIRLA